MTERCKKLIEKHKNALDAANMNQTSEIDL